MSEVVITVNPHGSLRVEGPVKVQTKDGVVLFEGTEMWLCRCGESSTKPFCDGTHKNCGFEHDPSANLPAS
jgi:CDGSH-type Zn-finger protein